MKGDQIDPPPQKKLPSKSLALLGLITSEAVFLLTLYVTLLLDIKSKLIKFCIKCWVKKPNYSVPDYWNFPCKCTSLLLCSKPVQQNFWHIFKNFKTQCAL